MHLRFTLFILLCSLFPQKIAAEPNTLYSMNTGSFLFHIVPFDTEANQYFNNHYFSVERKFSKESDYSLFAGTFLNSQNNRCILLGMRKDWYNVNNQLVIKGVYSYAGEFFFDAFEDCGDGGVYRTAKDRVGVAAVPYVYHAAQYNFNDHFGVEAGFILPFILVMSVQWSF